MGWIESSLDSCQVVAALGCRKKPGLDSRLQINPWPSALPFMARLFFMKGSTVWGVEGQELWKAALRGMWQSHSSQGPAWLGQLGGSRAGNYQFKKNSHELRFRLIFQTPYKYRTSEKGPNNLTEVSERSSHIWAWAGEMLSWENNPVLDHLKEGSRSKLVLSAFHLWELGQVPFYFWAPVSLREP